MRFIDFKQSDLSYYRRYLVTVLPLLSALLLAVVNDPLTPMARLLLVLAVLLGLGGTVYLAHRELRKMLRPLYVLARAMRRLEEGRSNVRVRECFPGEIGVLQRGFNKMAEQVASVNKRLQEEVDHTTAELRETNEELEIRNAELDVARRRAIEANRVKSDFLASMSHEIRTPMNGIIGFTELLTGTELDEQQKEYAHTIRRSAESLMRLIGDILDYAKLESSRITLRHEPFRIRDTVDSALQLIAPSAHRKGLELIALVYRDVPEALVGDEPRIIQIMTNLLSNAVKFTHEGEVVLRVMLEQEREHRMCLGLSVSDTGIGLSEREAETLMEAFSRGAHVSKGAEGGAGLGLAICQNLARAMEGELAVSSEPGKGATFHVSIHLDKADGPMDPLDSGIAAPGRRVLLVEPHGLGGIVLRNQLEELGFEVEQTDELEPFDTTELFDHDLVLLSTSASPQQIEYMKLQLQGLMERGIPALALLNSSDQTLFQELREAGTVATASRPVARQRLWALIRKALRQPRAAGGSGHLPEAAAQVPAAPPSPRSSGLLHGVRAVVADDNEINLELVTRLLRDRGAEVLLASNGKEALDLCRRERVDVAILDLHMPVMNGLEAAREIRDSTPDMALVALTADAAETNQVAILRAGFDVRLVKPISGDTLAATIREAIAGDSHLADLAPPETEFRDAARPTVHDRKAAIRVAGNEQIARQLLSSLCGELPDAVPKLTRWFDESDWDNLRQGAHRLKGSAAICCLPALQAALGGLEAAAARHNAAESGIALARIQRESNRVIALTRSQFG